MSAVVVWLPDQRAAALRQSAELAVVCATSSFHEPLSVIRLRFVRRTHLIGSEVRSRLPTPTCSTGVLGAAEPTSNVRRNVGPAGNVEYRYLDLNGWAAGPWLHRTAPKTVPAAGLQCAHRRKQVCLYLRRWSYGGEPVGTQAAMLPWSATAFRRHFSIYPSQNLRKLSAGQ
jgi:hypothetical protein